MISRSPARRGQLGCIENYLSGRGFARLYEHFYQHTLTSPEIVALWQQGDARAHEHVERYLDLLAVCLGNILMIVDPDLLVLGGGLSNFTAISEGLAQRLPRHLLPLPGYRVLNVRAMAMPEACAVRPSFI